MTREQVECVRITFENGLWYVRWVNVGSFTAATRLQHEPRCFGTRDEARTFCRAQGVRVVS